MSAFKDAVTSLDRTLADVEHSIKAKGRSKPAGDVAYGPLGDALGGNGGALASLLSGGSTSKQQQNYNLFKHWVFVCINAIAKRLAGQPITLAELTNTPETQVPVGAAAYQGTKALATGTVQGVKPLPEHAMHAFLQKPNPIQRKFEFIYCSAANLYITGECYWIFGVKEGSTDSSGWEMWAVPSSWIVPDHRDGMFRGYFLKPPGTVGEGEPLKPNQVARTYFPDPSNLKGAISPVETQLQAIKVDTHIQNSQEESFAIPFPNVLLHVGKNIGPDGKPMDSRPVLSGKQRAQLIRAVHQVWDASAGRGHPGIIDGLIEQVTKLSNMPAEMDWQNSGEAVKKRIFAAFGVNPIITGEIAGANRAQATEAEKNFCGNVINPVADCMSVTLTDSICRAVDPSGKLVARIEPAVPVDEDLLLRKWGEARRNNDVTEEEYRATILGLPPNPNREQPKPLLASTVGGIQGAVTILTGVAQGAIAEDAAVKMLVYFFEMDEATARAMAAKPEIAMLPGPGMPGDPNADPNASPAAKPKPKPGATDDEETDNTDEPVSKAIIAVADANQFLLSELTKAVTGKEGRLSRGFIRAASAKQSRRLESEVKSRAATFFADSLRKLAEYSRALPETLPPTPIQRPRLPASRRPSLTS